MNSNHLCWNNFQKLTQPQFWITKNWLITWKRLKQQQTKFKNNQKSPKLLKSTLTHKEKFIVQSLLKELCFTSCVFLSASLTTCINIHLKVSLSSSSKPYKELSKKTRQELVSWFKTLDIQFTNGFQEDSLKSINSFSCPWLHSD